jgi:hypothetical protein
VCEVLIVTWNLHGNQKWSRSSHATRCIQLGQKSNILETFRFPIFRKFWGQQFLILHREGLWNDVLLFWFEVTLSSEQILLCIVVNADSWHYLYCASAGQHIPYFLALKTHFFPRKMWPKFNLRFIWLSVSIVSKCINTRSSIIQHLYHEIMKFASI